MRYGAILIIWTLCYFLPIYAGDWYDSGFHYYQSAISLFLLFAVLKLSREWWVKEYGCLCVLQIIHNLGDLFFDFPVSHYSRIQDVFNFLELALIVGAGGLTQLYRWHYGRSARRSDSDDGPRQAVSGVPKRSGNA